MVKTDSKIFVESRYKKEVKHHQQYAHLAYIYKLEIWWNMFKNILKHLQNIPKTKPTHL